jgi:phosphate transport system permease protein
MKDDTISRPPSRRQVLVDSVFRRSCQAAAALLLLLVAFIVLRISTSALPAMREFGLGFLTGTTWDPNQGRHAILPEIWGTLYTSVLGLLVGTAFGLSAAVFLAEGYLSGAVYRLLSLLGLATRPGMAQLPDRLEQLLRNLVELLAAIPSVVYGLWGIFVVIPMVRPVAAWLHESLGWIPLFGTELSGPGVLPAVLVLGIMIMPTITALSRDAIVSVPPKLRMAAYGLGATRWETIFAVILPTAARGIFGGVVLAFGRALGETMALAMLVGNSNRISVSLFSPANTLAALLANSFPEAGPKQVTILMFAALVLLGITLLVNVAGAAMLQRASRQLEEAR